MCGGHNHKHPWLMMLGCALPLLMIFILPVLGVREGWVLPLALGAMLLCHLITSAFASRGDHTQAKTGGSHAHH
jgi:hypothetical protein